MKNNCNKHARVQDKYKTASLIGKTAREQAEININSELRSAVRSHIETWQWKSGGIRLHLEKMKVNTLKVMIRVVHSTSLRLTEQTGRETSDKAELLELT